MHNDKYRPYLKPKKEAKYMNHRFLFSEFVRDEMSEDDAKAIVISTYNFLMDDMANEEKGRILQELFLALISTKQTS